MKQIQNIYRDMFYANIFVFHYINIDENIKNKLKKLYYSNFR